ncbi:Ldh family oxidoreductase [Noviherbaspirillum aerium]|uniref:Ldh family oxidoreductase n=1 Tax=Noviherbaspirillum aerium TaxID=2588497 RepID=UPI001CEF6DAA|nr:Ldh family oxidoreductase [Noviherbaspirillum aerium]
MNEQTTDSQSKRIPAEELMQWSSDAFAACGMSRQDADTGARVLLRTSLRGIDTHGVSRLPVYVEKLCNGEVDPHAQPLIESRHGALHCDGRNGLGQVVASRAMAETIATARATALAACTIRNSGHLAALGMFLLQASEQGMFALLCQKTPPLMALPGSTARAIGNNPIAFSMPVNDGPPMVFDMASSVVARGNVLQAVRDKLPSIPEGWAIGPDGMPTTDPTQALAGAMLPVAGYKGIGLAMLVECLAGSFSGTEPARNLNTGTAGSASDASAFLLVINPELMFGRAAFDAYSSAWLQHYLQASGPFARYPGQRQAACEAERLREGIPLPAALREELRQVGERLGIGFHW